jgi:hypothetical protein
VGGEWLIKLNPYLCVQFVPGLKCSSRPK